MHVNTCLLLISKRQEFPDPDIAKRLVYPQIYTYCFETAVSRTWLKSIDLIYTEKVTRTLCHLRNFSGVYFHVFCYENLTVPCLPNDDSWATSLWRGMYWRLPAGIRNCACGRCFAYKLFYNLPPRRSMSAPRVRSTRVRHAARRTGNVRLITLRKSPHETVLLSIRFETWFIK